MSEEEATELGILSAGVHLHLALLQKIAFHFILDTPIVGVVIATSVPRQQSA